ncbi:hypothetical protein PF049_08735 [Erythrobacteraceae bacterium WH01K]|nr:hypothetical protein PF049_08735 [Erythrobacteraceae bacterium WH01K]
MKHTATAQHGCREAALRQLARQWQDDLETLDAMGLHLAAARLDGALSTVKRSLAD